MSKYAKIENGKVIQVQPYQESGFILVPDDTVPGQLDNGDGTFSNPPPTPEPDATQATTLQLLDEMAARGLEDSLFAAMTPQEQRRFLGAQIIHKDHPLVVAFLTAQGFDAAGIIYIFNKAAAR